MHLTVDGPRRVSAYFQRELMGLEVSFSSIRWNTYPAEHLHKTDGPVRSIEWKAEFLTSRGEEFNEARELVRTLTTGRPGTPCELKRRLS